MKPAEYRKLIAALVSMGVFAFHVLYGINLGPLSGDIMTVVLAVLNPLVVWWFPNEAR
ncbi:MAG: hypothetical protein ACTSU0_10415 [Alphaproteobacteria bacterium]